MKELIKIENRNGIETVNARELHNFLGVGRDFSNWIKNRIEKFNFIEGEDFITTLAKTGERQNVVMKDYYITFDMAKELSMVENNDRGREARRYFIEVEKRARQISTPKLSDDELVLQALLIQKDKITRLEKKIEQDRDKVQFFHDVTGSRDAIEMSKVAKIIDCGMGRNQLMEFLRKNGVLRNNNEPYQKYVDQRWFRVIEQKYEAQPGETKISIKTLVYQKGIDGILKLINKNRI